MGSCGRCHNPLSTSTFEHYGSLRKPVCRDCWFARIPDVRNYKRPARKGDYVSSLTNREISGFVVKRVKAGARLGFTHPRSGSGSGSGYIVRLMRPCIEQFILAEQLDIVIDGQVYQKYQATRLQE